MAAGRKTHIFAETSTQDVILEPGEVGLPIRERITIGPDVQQHANLNRAILEGKSGPATEQVCLTVAAILKVLEIVTDLPTGMNQARSLITSGRAQKRLEMVAK